MKKALKAGGAILVFVALLLITLRSIRYQLLGLSGLPVPPGRVDGPVCGSEGILLPPR